MKCLIQRVSEANVCVNTNKIAQIQQGLCVFVGFAASDATKTVDELLKKMLQLRIFSNEKGLFDLSLSDVKGDLLWVSQFTLLADCKKGRRPFFGAAAKPEKAKQLFDYGFEQLKMFSIGALQKGQFGADMQVSLQNDGPVSIILDSDCF